MWWCLPVCTHCSSRESSTRSSTAVSTNKSHVCCLRSQWWFWGEWLKRRAVGVGSCIVRRSRFLWWELSLKSSLLLLVSPDHRRELPASVKKARLAWRKNIWNNTKRNCSSESEQFYLLPFIHSSFPTSPSPLALLENCRFSEAFKLEFST